MKHNRILNILIASLIVILALIFAFEHMADKQNERAKALADNEANINRIATDDNAINLMPYTSEDVTEGNESVVLSYVDFLDDCIRTSYHVGETSVEYRFPRTMVSGGSDIYVLNFKMRAEDSAAQINVRFGEEYVYYLTTQWREFFVPCTKGEINNIKIRLLTEYQKLYIKDVRVLKYSSLNIDYSRLKNGSYNVDGIDTVYFSENDGLGLGVTMDVVTHNGYLYSAGDEKLKISRIEENGVTQISTVEGIGNIRHIDIRNENLIAAASRETGVYLIDITDKENPFIVSYYDSLEIANDVCFSGKYMFVAGRYFGVEVVDISDITNPRYVTRIVNNKECFRVVTDEQYLFVSCWSTLEVEVYDISTVNEPELISALPVEGRCAEAFVQDDKLFVASGYHATASSIEVGDAQYGTGNGLTVYDISDIKHPKWLSTIKTEGSLFGSGNDDWSVQVSDGYAYFTNSFGGMYIYDVSDVTAPKAVAYLGAKVLSDSKNFRDFSKNTRTVFPYDETQFVLSPAMGVCVADNKVFFACAYTDVYVYEFGSAKSVENRLQEFNFSISTKERFNYQNYDILLPQYDIYAIEKSDNRYIAATAEGLLILDKGFNEIDKLETDNPVKDVKITSDGYIVTAERIGIGVYKLGDTGVESIGFVNSNAANKNVSALGVTGDGNFAIVQSSWTKYEAVDLRNKNNPVFVESILSQNGKSMDISYAPNAGNMYYRNIVSGTVNGTVGIGGGNTMIWFESTGDDLKLVNSYSNKFGSEINGNAALGDRENIVSIYMNGFVIYNPLTADAKALSNASRRYISGVLLKGKVSYDNGIMVISNESKGAVFIANVADFDTPYLEEYFETPQSPGIALIDGKTILVPLRHGGIMITELD